jgi:hypothetical protein
MEWRRIIQAKSDGTYGSYHFNVLAFIPFADTLIGHLGLQRAGSDDQTDHQSCL